MSDVQALFREMERLSLGQLEHLHEFISRLPYKVEKRDPTHEELKQVLAEVRRLLAEPQVSEEDEALDRLQAVMKQRQTG